MLIFSLTQKLFYIYIVLIRCLSEECRIQLLIVMTHQFLEQNPQNYNFVPSSLGSTDAFTLNNFPSFLFFLSLSAFDGEHCYEPYLPHGNFSSSDITFPLGTVVTFSCSPGFVMEQGSGVMECVEPNDPHWNESEPVCRGTTSHIFLYLTHIPVHHL